MNRPHAKISPYGRNDGTQGRLPKSTTLPMLVGPDFRKEYGELRLIGYGRIRGRCMTIAFTRRGEAIRVITLGKANRREQERFKKEIRDRLKPAGFHER